MAEKPEMQVEGIRPKKVIVEIGPGGNPYPFRTKKDLKDSVYLGVERSDAKISKIFNELEGAQKNSLTVAGDAYHAPVVDNSVDEIICNNIFGDTYRFPDFEKMFQEVTRILKVGGQVVITDTLTPGMMLHKFGASKQQSAEEVRAHVQDYLEKNQIKLTVAEVTFARDNAAPIEEYTGPKEEVLAFDKNTVQIILKKT